MKLRNLLNILDAHLNYNIMILTNKTSFITNVHDTIKCNKYLDYKVKKVYPDSIMYNDNIRLIIDLSEE